MCKYTKDEFFKIEKSFHDSLASIVINLKISPHGKKKHGTIYLKYWETR